MKNFLIGSFWVINSIIVIIILYTIFLSPSHDYATAVEAKDSVNIMNLIKKSLPQNFSLENRKINVDIVLSDKDINSLIMSNFNDKGDIIATDVKIDNNKMDIYIEKKVLNFIPVEISLSFSGKYEDDKQRLFLEYSKFGKFEIDRRKILNKINDTYIPFVQVKPASFEILLEDKSLNDIVQVADLKLYDNKLVATVEITINSFEDFFILAKLLK